MKTEKLKSWFNSRPGEISTQLVLVVLFTILGAESGLGVLDVLVYYSIMGVLTINWTTFCKPMYKWLVFGICTFISVIISITIFDVNPLIIGAMTVIVQVYSLIISTKQGN